jgi:hypothetical protein
VAAGFGLPVLFEEGRVSERLCLQAHGCRNQVEGGRRSAMAFLLGIKIAFCSIVLRRCTLVGVCLDEQIVNEVPREAHDATVDMCAYLLICIGCFRFWIVFGNKENLTRCLGL